MESKDTFSSSLLTRGKEALVRSVIWAFIGLLYGMLFIFFSELCREWELPVQPYFFSTVLAGTIGALIYSSMRLAVLLAAIISPVCILIFTFADTPVMPGQLFLIVGPAGAVIGALYGMFVTSSRVYRADAKMLTGFAAGFLAALGYLVFARFLDELSLGLLVGIMCIVTGWTYVLFVPTFIRYHDNLLPPFGDGALVGTGVAIFLGVCFFIMTTSISTAPEMEMLHLIQRIDASLLQAMIGGLIGGAFSGLLSGLFLTKWQDL